MVYVILYSVRLAHTTKWYRTQTSVHVQCILFVHMPTHHMWYEKKEEKKKRIYAGTRSLALLIIGRLYYQLYHPFLHPFPHPYKWPFIIVIHRNCVCVCVCVCVLVHAMSCDLMPRPQISRKVSTSLIPSHFPSGQGMLYSSILSRETGHV